MDCVKSEPCFICKIPWFKKIGCHNMTVLYPNPCYNKVHYKRECTAYKETAVYL